MLVLYVSRKEQSMNLQPLFAPAVLIRLTDDLNGFVCTVHRGWFHRTSEFAIESRPAQFLESDQSPARTYLVLDDGEIREG